MADAANREREEDTGAEGIPTGAYDGAAVGPGGQIGAYKLLRILGEGGYGIVYLAEQQRPVKRRVALKVIKPGMDSKQVIARFEAERQALALLDHPNIAHVFSAGTTKTGRPYFAMEYVQGVPITEHCDRYKLTVEERLKVTFRQAGMKRFCGGGTGQYQVWIEQINGGVRRQVSTDGGLEAVWCRTGELFYRQGNRLLANHITLEPSLDVGPPKEVFTAPDFVDTKGISFRVSSDGERLFYIRRSNRPAIDRINIVHNWFSELARLAPADKGTPVVRPNTQLE